MAEKISLVKTAPKKSVKKPAKKVNKTDKVKAAGTPVDKSDGFVCCCCGHKYAKQDGNFYICRSPIYYGNNGYMSICRSCLFNLYDQFVKFYDGDEYAAAERICQITDYYFDETCWEMSRYGSQSQSRFSRYVTRVARQFNSTVTSYSDTLIARFEKEERESHESGYTISGRDINGDDSEAAEVDEYEGVSEQIDQDIGPEPEEPERDPMEDIEPDTIRRFGVGFTAQDYQSLQIEFDDWVKKYGNPMDKRQEELYITICLLKLSFQKNVRDNGSGIGNLAGQYRSTIESATVEIEDRIRTLEAEKAKQISPLGKMIQDMETYTPAEFYKDKKLYADYDKLRDYFKRLILRPMRNLIGGLRDMDPEYNLRDNEELP